MPDRADAHAHLFHPGYADKLPETCRRIHPDEVTLYHALAKNHDVRQLLTVGFEGAEPYRGNNDYLAQLASKHEWVRPTAYFDEPAQISVAALESRRRQGFVGISLYLFARKLTDQLGKLPDEMWKWLIQHRWLISVNSKGEHWSAWRTILTRHPQLRLVISHLGLPGVIEKASKADDRLATVLALAEFPQVRVKLSGFYALSDPPYDYPHRNAWPLVERLLESFTARRLLWGSDFSPALEQLSFPQTIGLFSQMPFLSKADRAQIEGQNLIHLLNEVQ